MKYFNLVLILKLCKQVATKPNLIFRFFKVIKSEGINIAIAKTKSYSNIYIYRKPMLTNIIENEIKKCPYKPLISIIMPVYNVNPKRLKLAIQSVERQWYKHWELCIAGDKSTNQKTIDFLKRLKNSKIKIKFLEKNLNISGASNTALELAQGEYIALMNHDDEITPDALYEVVKAINETGAEFIYSDEDKIDINGRFVNPDFKPDFSPDMFLSQNYISNLSVIQKKLVDKVFGFEIGLEGAHDYDLFLKIIEHTKKIYHISKVLYHCRKIPATAVYDFSHKSFAQEAGRKAIENAVKRRKIKAEVLNGKYPGTYRVKYHISQKPLVSIIIPFRDKPELIVTCIETLLKKSTYKNYEIIGISNNSTNEKTFETMEFLKKRDNRIKFVEYNIPFNFSKLNNYAVHKVAKGSQIVLMNNDIEVITPEWIESMLEFSQREDIGAVGAKLYYPNDKIQHAGLIIGIGGVAGHSHKFFSKDDLGYCSRLCSIQNVSAVTAALMMVKKTVYIKVGGFDEKNLPIAFNDVDLCLRIREAGYLNVWTPYCEAYHHESASRGYEDNPEKIERFNKEFQYMLKRHAEVLHKGDPYYNPNLSLTKEDFSFICTFRS